MNIKKLSLLALLLGAFTCSRAAEPRVLTVDNNPGAVAMFKTLQAAYDAAEPGDTLLIAGSATPYERLDVQKRLHLVGPGYLLTENNAPGLSKYGAYLPSILFGRGDFGSSEGSTVTGLSGYSIWIGTDIGGGVRVDASSTSELLPPVDGIIIERCVYNDLRANGQVSVRQCNISGADIYSSKSIVRNSIVMDIDLHAENTTINNCIIYSRISAVAMSSISNTIFLYDGVAPSPAEFASRVKGSVSYSMAINASFLPEGGGNINNVLRGPVFVTGGSEDSKWRLREGSPAIGKGFGGVDMGAFGGPSPYVLSGVPARPRITRFVVPALVTPASGLKFEVDAQSF